MRELGLTFLHEIAIPSCVLGFRHVNLPMTRAVPSGSFSSCEAEGQTPRRAPCLLHSPLTTLRVCYTACLQSIISIYIGFPTYICRAMHTFTNVYFSTPRVLGLFFVELYTFWRVSSRCHVMLCYLHVNIPATPMRRGGATSLLQRGCPIDWIKGAGRWLSVAWKRCFV